MFCTNCGKEAANGGIFCHNCGQKTSKNVESSVNAQSTASTIVSQNFSPISREEYEKRKNRNRKIGLWWLLAPIITLVGVLMLYAIVSFVMNQLSTAGADDGTGNSYVVIAQIIRVLMGLVGIVAVIGIIVGIPLGIIYLSKREEFAGLKFDSRSGKGVNSEIPSEINHWNWGAAGLTWIWGASHRVWIAFLAFIPLVNIIVLIYLGIEGNKLAWRADKWESVDKFLETERRWKPWGIVFFILGILVTLSKLGSVGN